MCENVNEDICLFVARELQMFKGQFSFFFHLVLQTEVSGIFIVLAVVICIC